MGKIVTAKPLCYVSIPSSPEFTDVANAVGEGARKGGYEPLFPSEHRRGSRAMSSVTNRFARSDCVIIDLSVPDVDVYYDLGIAQAMSKPLFILVRESLASQIPTEFARHALFLYEPTPHGLTRLTRLLSHSLDSQRRAPARAKPVSDIGLTSPFFIDWSRLDDSDVDNLLRELFMQLGFSKIDWTNTSRVIDLIAEFPKKDPDGFEYRETWMASVGRRFPLDKMLGPSSTAADAIYHTLMIDIQRMSPVATSDSGPRPITVLIISLSDDISPARVGDLFKRLELRSTPSAGLHGVRFRLWTRDYLSSLIRQFPLIGFKYFSDEGRARAKYRKTPEELYTENVALFDEKQRLAQRLQAETALRIKAQRDAIWKDISFSAAHKLGNPIFAIETNLEPLRKRVAEIRTTESLEVIEDIQHSVDSAKEIIWQFKSLSRAQNNRILPILLEPMLEQACAVAKQSGMDCSVTCRKGLTVLADAQHLSECLDELVANSIRWTKTDPRRITITAMDARPDEVPADALDRTYACIHFEDSGPGIAPENKSIIFDLFFTTSPDGTGLGLSLVKRIIEGHEGTISEIGTFGKGSHFIITIPSTTDLTDSISGAPSISPTANGD